MEKLTIKEKIELFAKYLGSEMWIRNIYHEDKTENIFGRLEGIQSGAILVEVRVGQKLWFNLLEECPSYEFKLLLKPLSKLSSSQLSTAKELPVPVFISSYYIKSGFDMPVFIAPGHQSNCKYLQELGLADYRSKDEITRQSLAEAI